ENILYLGGYGYYQGAKESPLNGAAAVVTIFIVRIVMTGFAHPLFTSMTGLGLGVAARAADRRVRWLAPVAGLLVAMMLHGTWNLMSVVSAATHQYLVILYGYFAVMMPIFFGMVGFALWLRGSEGRLTERVLGAYVRAGWFSPPEVASLGTLGRRLAARRWARRVAGDAGATAMRAFQFDATKLALLRDGMRRGMETSPDRLTAAINEARQLPDAIPADRRRPGQAPAHRGGRRDHDARRGTALALGAVEADEVAVVQQPDRQSGLVRDGTGQDGEAPPAGLVAVLWHCGHPASSAKRSA